MSKNFLFFGFGQVAKSFVDILYEKKETFNFITTSRESSQKKYFKNTEYKSFNLNEKSFDKSLINELGSVDHILISIPPINGEDIVNKHFGKFFNSKKIKWITYLSATSVYGDHKGDWVNEKSLTNPTSKNGIARLDAENVWKNLSEKINLQIQIFRLAGIYSKNFNILKRLQNGKIQVVDKKNHFFSRIHIEDIATILYKSLNNFKSGEIYNICDDKPAPQSEIAAYGAKLLKLKVPKFIKLDEVDSEMLKNFYKDSKKVENKKMKSFFKYNLKFPTYIEGLNYIFNNRV